MTNPNPPITPETIQRARDAIQYVLTRVRDDKNVQNCMGYGTQAFSLLCEAEAAFAGSTKEEVVDLVFPIHK